jgi:hypothetical protein
VLAEVPPWAEPAARDAAQQRVAAPRDGAAAGAVVAVLLDAAAAAPRPGVAAPVVAALRPAVATVAVVLLDEAAVAEVAPRPGAAAPVVLLDAAAGAEVALRPGAAAPVEPERRLAARPSAGRPWGVVWVCRPDRVPPSAQPAPGSAAPSVRERSGWRMAWSQSQSWRAAQGEGCS